MASQPVVRLEARFDSPIYIVLAVQHRLSYNCFAN